MVTGSGAIGLWTPPRRRRRLPLLALAGILAGLLGPACARLGVLAPEAGVPEASPAAFRVTVVDADTGRGIPAVELRTTDDRTFYTDSAGVIALQDSDLLGRRVFFGVRSFGYTYERQPFGWPGTVLDAASGGAAVLEMRRRNVAERLYRVTGSGIYRHSERLGDDVPVPTRDRTVVPTGMDSAHATVYRGALFWVWGDTNVLSAPLGNFRTTAARSKLPGRGGLDPRRGVEFEYFLEGNRLRPMVADDHRLIWLTALRAARDAAGREHLFATYQKIEPPLSTLESGLAEFDDQAGVFRIVSPHPEDAPIVPKGVVFRHVEEGRPYLHYDMHVRSPDTAEGVRDASSYEAYTPLRPGRRLDRIGADLLERDSDGRLVWGWKAATAPVPPREWDALVREGIADPREAPYRLIDVETGETVRPHAGSIHWNEQRRRWVMIRSRTHGNDSHLGEVYYFEADTPLGPWAYGRKIVTHSMPAPPRSSASGERWTYTFYNPIHHPELDRAGGREILFEGTMSVRFAGNPAPRIPGYNYNQMMYRLDLEDPRLFLPVAVYRAPGGGPSYRTLRDHTPPGPRWKIAFFAPDRPREGTVPVREVRSDDGPSRLVADRESPGPVRFYCAQGPDPPPMSVPLYERRTEPGRWIYSTDPEGAAERVLCHVWPKPVDFPPALRHPPEVTPTSTGDEAAAGP